MNIKLLFLYIITLSILHSCKNEVKDQIQNEELMVIEINNDANRICNCFEKGRNNSKKYMECSAENEKVRSKYLHNKKHIDLYDLLLNECH